MESSSKSPSKMLENLGNMLLESAKALAASKHGHDPSHDRSSTPSRRRRSSRSRSPEKPSAVTTVDDDHDNESSDGESYLSILLYI